jgi:hypothetical protein
MSKKRLPSPTDEDIFRFAETIKNIDLRREVQDYPSFSKAWQDYFDNNPYMQKRTDLKEEAFNSYVEMFPYRVKSREIRETKAMPQKAAREYKYIGKIKNRQVYAYSSIIIYKEKKYTRYRDAKGRFASVPKDEKG